MLPVKDMAIFGGMWLLTAMPMLFFPVKYLRVMRFLNRKIGRRPLFRWFSSDDAAWLVRMCGLLATAFFALLIIRLVNGSVTPND